jgi:hypothetical protein
VSRDELFHVLGTFGKDKSPGPDGWTVEFYIDFFDMLGEDLLWVVEDVQLWKSAWQYEFNLFG